MLASRLDAATDRATDSSRQPRVSRVAVGHACKLRSNKAYRSQDAAGVAFPLACDWSRRGPTAPHEVQLPSADISSPRVCHRNCCEEDLGAGYQAPRGSLFGMATRALSSTPLILALGLTDLPAQQEIMPIGDSITHGVPASYWASMSPLPQRTYRYHLWEEMHTRGWCADFVGTQSGIGDDDETTLDFDPEHFGYGGYRTVDIDSLLVCDMTGCTFPNADIALIQLGANDIILPLAFGSGVDLPGALAGMKSIVAKLQMQNPNIKIAIATILPIDPVVALLSQAPTHVTAWNTVYLPQVVSWSTATSPVILVDQNTGFTHPTHFVDFVHLNDQGEQMLAYNWANALTGSGWMLSGAPCVATLSPGCVDTTAVPQLPIPLLHTPVPSVSNPTLTVTLSSMPTGTTDALLVIGLSTPALPVLWGLMQCPIYPSIDLLLPMVVSGSTGTCTLSTPSMPPGFRLYFQAATAVTAGTVTIEEATSNGLQLTWF